MAMQEPGPRVIRDEPEGDIVCPGADTDGVSTDRVVEVVCRTACDSYDIERMLHMYIHSDISRQLISVRKEIILN